MDFVDHRGPQLEPEDCQNWFSIQRASGGIACQGYYEDPGHNFRRQQPKTVIVIIDDV